MENLNSKFQLSLIWSVFGKFGYMIIIFISNIILARLLSPQEFGILAIAFFFIAISNVLVESGLGGALIREQNTSEEDYSTIFIFNLIISIFLYGLLFIFSWKIEEYYNIPQFNVYLKVLGLILIINAFKIIQNVRLIKALDYKKISLYNMIAVIGATSLGITIAILGYGVWALIILQVFNALFSTILFNFFVKNIKIFVFNRKSFKKLYHFGLFTTLSSFLNTVFDNIYQLILSKYFNLNQTGYYYQGKRLTELPVSLINFLNSGVIFSTLSNIQNNKQKFNDFYSNTIRIFTVVIGFICLSIFLYAKEILSILYGSEWLGAEFYMKIFAIAYFFYMQESFNRILFKVFNKTDKIFILEIIKKSTLSVSIVIGVYFKSIEFLLYGFLITYIISYYINYYVSRTIYNSKSIYMEMIYLHKVLGVSLFISLSFEMINNYFYLKIFYLPLVIVLYIILLQFLKVIDYQNDFKFIKSLNKLK